MRLYLLFFLACFSGVSIADDCSGEGEYQICTSTDTDINGDTTVSSYDTDGNNYSITSGSRDHADGSSESFSRDSDGNEYTIKTWCDSDGCHTSDSDGNMCTVTNTGQTVGC
ncbi:hypothetical protein QM201_16855 [Enterobacter asburiae]|nr:hypothetical protein [Enterobacter asburiae]